MKIDCLSYFNPLKYSGGGEMITRTLIEEGRRRGHTVRLRSVGLGALLNLCKRFNCWSRRTSVSRDYRKFKESSI